MSRHNRVLTIALSATLLALPGCRDVTSPLPDSHQERDPAQFAFGGPELFPRDLGTLGGTWSIPTDINDLGTVVGRSETSDGLTRAFRWSNHAGMTDLGVLAGDWWSAAVAITNDGRIYGVSGGGSAGEEYTTVVVWTAAGEIHPLTIPLLPGATVNIPTDANALGQVVGWSDVGPGRAWIWSEPDGIYDIGTGTNMNGAYPFAVTDIGLVVGQGSFFGSELHAFKWRMSLGMIDLGVGEQAAAYDADNRGKIVGSAKSSRGGNPIRPRTWTRLGFTGTLPAPDGGEGEIHAMNILGDGVGWVSTSLGGTPQAAVWWHPMGAGARPIGPPDPAGSFALGINQARLVIGTSPVLTGGATHAVLWSSHPAAPGAADPAARHMRDPGTTRVMPGPAGCLADPGLVSKWLLAECLITSGGR